MARRIIDEIPGGGAGRAAGLAVLPLILLALAAVVGMASYHVVPPGNRGVLITMGRVSPEALPEGLNWKLPFISRVQDIEIRQRRMDGVAQCFSSDLQNIGVQYTVLYRSPADKVVTLFQQYAGEAYQNLVDPRVQEVMKQATARYRAEELVKSREKVKDEVLAEVKAAVGELVEVNDLTISNIELSKQLEAAIEQKVVREQEALAKTFELDKARKDAEITIIAAEAEARSVLIKGEALKTAPDVISLEIARKWDGKAPTSVVTTEGGANILLPLK